jgi:hypothetical protein
VEGIADYKDLKGKVLTRTLHKGQPCSPKDLLALPPGTQPLTVWMRIADRNILFFLMPDTRMDVICKVQTDKGAPPQYRMFLEDLLVLALDPADDGKSHQFHFTFAVTAEQRKSLLEALATRDLLLVAHADEETPGP